MFYVGGCELNSVYFGGCALARQNVRNKKIRNLNPKRETKYAAGNQETHPTSKGSDINVFFLELNLFLDKNRELQWSLYTKPLHQFLYLPWKTASEHPEGTYKGHPHRRCQAHLQPMQ